jgi:4-amino-4-deoxy-L-arabinose transferase-like glycosyltransferase
MGRDLRGVATLFVILLVATALRFAGIDHHLAHDPMDFDEMNNFVEPILKMWRTRSPNPTVYSGYPGFFNWLAFVPVVLGQRLAGGYGAYVGGRAVVAGFGVANVWLVYRLCRSWLGLGPALLGAALMAVSRGHVRAAHAITPDVVVATAALALLIVLRRAKHPGDWRIAGALCGLATAVKYTGLLTLPALAAGLWLRPDRRRSLSVAGIAAVLAFGIAAPYAVVATTSMGSGFEHSIHHYYGADSGANRVLQGQGGSFRDVVQYLVLDVGLVGLLLALLGLGLHRPRRDLFPALLLIGATLLATAPANKVYSRHVLGATAVAIVLAAVGFAALLERLASSSARRLVCGAGAALVLALPAREAFQMAWTYRGPTGADRAVAWVEGHLAGNALIASAVDPFEPDPKRFEVRGPLPVFDLSPEVRAHYDALVAAGPIPKGQADLETVAEFCDGPKGVACEFTILRPRNRPVLSPVPPLSAIDAGSGDAHAVVDGDPATSWQAPPGLTRVSLRWNEPQKVTRVEIEVDDGDTSWPQTIDFEGISPKGESTPLLAVPLRPVRTRRQRPGTPHGQSYAITAPLPLNALVLVRGDGPAWSISEIRILTDKNHRDTETPREAKGSDQGN